MKSLILFISILASTTSMARSVQYLPEVIARYAISEDYTDDGQIYGIVKVYDDQTMTVDHFYYDWSNSWTGKAIGSDQIVLSDLAFKRIHNMITHLSSVELERTESQYVCMMMPLPGPSRALVVKRDYNWETRMFAGELTTVMSNTGCWDPVKINPKHEYGVRSAVELMGALEVLTLQLVSATAK